MRHDAQLIEYFLVGYRDCLGGAYQIVERPEEMDRAEPAVEAIARNSRGERLAIEHTLLQPFEGQMADDPAFLAAFGRLHDDASLRIPDRLIELIVPVGSIPKGQDWAEIGDKVVEWFYQIRSSLIEGDSDHTIPGLPFPLNVHIQTLDVPDTEGFVSVSRLRPMDRPFADVVRRALDRKLPKLLGTPANRHMLLFEQAVPAFGLVQITREIDSARGDYPGLAHLDEIWVVSTVALQVAKIIWFFKVWPAGVTERFRLRL